MKRKYLFDLLDDYPENIPQDSLFDDTGVNAERIAKLVSDRTAADRKKPKMRFAKKFLLIAATIVAVGSLTAAVVMKFIDFNMDEPINLEMRNEIIKEEQSEYYEAIYNELNKYSDRNSDLWDKYKDEDNLKSGVNYKDLSNDISVSAYDTLIRNNSRRILDILKKYDRIDKDATPDDVCDTFIKRVMLTDEDTEKYCNYVRSCVDLFYDDSITEKEKVYLELFLEKALVVTHGAVNIKTNNTYDNSNKLSCWVITMFNNTIERSESSNKKINDTYEMIYNTIKRTIGNYNPDDKKAIKNRADELKIYIDDEKLNNEYERFKTCILLSDYENCFEDEDIDFIKYEEMNKKYNETHNYDEAYEEMRIKLSRLIGEEIPTEEEYNEALKNVTVIPEKYVNSDYYFDYVKILAGLKLGEDCFRTMQKTLDRFNVSYDCTTEDYYYNCDKFSDFIILCCDFVKEHRDELTDEEMFALYNISGSSIYLLSSADKIHQKITDFLVSGYLSNYFTKNADEIIRLTGWKKNKKEDSVIKGSKADVKALQIFYCFTESRAYNMNHFMRDDLNPPMYYIQYK